MKIKIQSVIDLITNSSTETFTILNGNAECIIRNIVDALLAFLESEDYEDCLKLAISMGGDSDTIAAMAGSIAYAYYGKMPQTIFDQVWDVLPEEMIDIVETFDDVCE